MDAQQGMKQQSKMLFVTDSPSPFNSRATCDIYLLIIFQKIHRKQQTKKEVLPIIKKSSFHVSFFQKSKNFMLAMLRLMTKKEEKEKKTESSVDKRWSWSGVSLILLSNDLHLFKIIDSWETELDGQEKVNYTYKIHVKSPNPSINCKPQNCLFGIKILCVIWMSVFLSSDISWWKIKSWFAQRSFSSWGTEWLQMPGCFLQGNPNSQHSKLISFLLNCIPIASCILLMLTRWCRIFLP